MLTVYITTSVFQAMRLQNTAVEPATILTALNNKVEWYEKHEPQVNLIHKLQRSTLLIGDPIVAGLSCYKNVWQKYFKSPKTVNCSIPGDKTQHVLWRAENLPIRSSIIFIVIHCGTNNLDFDDPNIIPKGILSIAKTMVRKARKSNIIITGLLPRDKIKSKRTNKLLKVNNYIGNFCKNEKNMLFISQGEDWILHDNILDRSLYYKDHTHLVEPGKSKFALNISNAINNFNELKYNLQSKVSRQLSAKPSLTFISKPLPTTSPPKPLPSIA